jgi:hypothetical protein
MAGFLDRFAAGAGGRISVALEFAARQHFPHGEIDKNEYKERRRLLDAPSEFAPPSQRDFSAIAGRHVHHHDATGENHDDEEGRSEIHPRSRPIVVPPHHDIFLG